MLREGSLSLARQFLAAGIHQVVSSLWDVDDESSLLLLIRFHEELSRGQDPAEALRRAQLSLLKGPEIRMQSLASCAGFELIGTGPGAATLNVEEKKR